MHLPRSAALALVTSFALAACAPQDSGNNTLVGSKSPAASQPPAGNGGAGSTEIEAKDNEFAPKELDVKAGDVTITLKNTGVSPHTFTSSELSVDQDVNAGKTVEIKLTGLKAGTFKFICKYHESLGMVGELKVS